MKNIEQLRDNLTRPFEKIKTGECDVKVATELNNTAGKIIATCKVQLEYEHLRSQSSTAKIAFLDVPASA